MQIELYSKLCNICQLLKKRNTIYVHLLPENIAELKPWDSVHVDLIRPYGTSIRQHHMGGTIIKTNLSLTCMTRIYSATDWFKIIEIPTYNLDEVTGGNDDYIDK